MYERPQFLTPDGYRRKRRNPSTDPLSRAEMIAAEKKRRFEAAKNTALAKKGQRQISDKAAKLIAEALRTMLRS